MLIDLSEEQEAFRVRARNYISSLMTEDFRRELKAHEHAHGGGPIYWEKLRQLGCDGWIAMSWPENIGGSGLSAVEQYLLIEEAHAVGFPWPSLSANSVGPMLARNAHPAIRDRVVGEILRGEAFVAIGYSEPQAGSDLASMRTRAVRDGDQWVINGQKIWTSAAHFARYIWLAARTDPDPAKRHKGISLFLVPTDAPGFSRTTIHTLGSETNVTYYQDVRVPADHLIGELNQGWKIITGQLNVERIMLGSYGHARGLYDETFARLRASPESALILQRPWVRRSLARCHAQLEVLRVMCLRATWTMEQGNSGMVESSTVKVYGSELYVEIGRRMGEIAGAAGLLAEGDDAWLDGMHDEWWRKGSVRTFAGGANELQRNIIATSGLGLPRSS